MLSKGYSHFLVTQNSFSSLILQNRGLGFLEASKQFKMAFVNSIPLVVEFQTKFYFEIWSILMKYIDSSGHLKH